MVVWQQKKRNFFFEQTKSNYYGPTIVETKKCNHAIRGFIIILLLNMIIIIIIIIIILQNVDVINKNSLLANASDRSMSNSFSYNIKKQIKTMIKKVWHHFLLACQYVIIHSLQQWQTNTTNSYF